MEQPKEPSHEEIEGGDSLREVAFKDMDDFRDGKTSVSTIVDQTESLGEPYGEEILKIINKALRDVESFLKLPHDGHSSKSDAEAVIFMTMELAELKRQLKEL